MWVSYLSKSCTFRAFSPTFRSLWSKVPANRLLAVVMVVSVVNETALTLKVYTLARWKKVSRGSKLHVRVDIFRQPRIQKKQKKKNNESGRSRRSLDSVAWSVGSGDLSVSMQMMWVENRMVCNRETRAAMRTEELDLVV